MSVPVHEAVCFDSAQKRFFFCDHFFGDQLKDEWVLGVVGGGGAVVDGEFGGVYRLLSGGADNDYAFIQWTMRTLLVSKRVSAEFRAKLNHITDINVYFNLLNAAGANYIMFRNTGGTWHMYCDDGATTNVDTGIAIDTDYHIFRIEAHIHGSNHVHFFYDGVECPNSPLSTNVTALYLQPRIGCQTYEDSEKTLDIDYAVIRQDR